MGIRVGFLSLVVVCTGLGTASAQSLARLVPNLVFAEVTIAPGPATTPTIPGTPHTAHLSPLNPLFGIDAPELSQSCDRDGEIWACGQASADELRAMIGNFELTCDGTEVDVYARLLAVCAVSGINLNRTMVAEGWATAFRRYSADYVADETRARASKLGLWSSSFASPEDYRMAQDAAAAEQAPRRDGPTNRASAAATSTACSCAPARRCIRCS